MPIPAETVALRLEVVLSGQPVAAAGWERCHPVEQARLLSWAGRGVTGRSRQDRLEWIAAWCTDGTLWDRVSGFGRSRRARRGSTRLIAAMPDEDVQTAWAASPARLRVLYAVWVGSAGSARESRRRVQATVLWVGEGSLQAHVSDQGAAQIIGDLAPPL